jgi:hypothetical protein
MEELKFKIKLHGKTVGYQRHKLTKHGLMMLQQRKPNGMWRTLVCGANVYSGGIDHDELCPFVCKDRNGQDVYEGDYIRAFQKMVDKRIADGLPTEWRTGQEVYDWWMQDPKHKDVPTGCWLFESEDYEIVAIPLDGA